MKFKFTVEFGKVFTNRSGLNDQADGSCGDPDCYFCGTEESNSTAMDEFNKAYQSLVQRTRQAEERKSKAPPRRVIAQVRPIQNGFLVTWAPDSIMPTENRTAFCSSLEEVGALMTDIYE